MYSKIIIVLREVVGASWNTPQMICILHGFPCEMDFTRVACDEGGIRRLVVRIPSRMEAIQNTVSCILYTSRRVESANYVVQS